MFLLTENHYPIVSKALEQVDFNVMFARSVLAGHISGRVYADCYSIPKSFYIAHDYGLSLLFGKTDNKQFNDELMNYFMENDGTRARDVQVQAFPRKWDNFFDNLITANKAKRYNRLNFTFDENMFIKNNPSFHNNQIKPTTLDMFNNIEGLVVPKEFWRDEREFMKKAASYTILVDDKPASTAFAAYRHDDLLEIGIETLSEYRGKGLARVVCVALINHCLENKLTPMWSCRLENTASVKLAKKLGFLETKRFPFYYIQS